MRINLTVLTVVAMLFFVGSVAIAQEAAVSEAVNVGNKICPISGEKIGGMGESVPIEHEGKIYNLCCTMCAKDFKKDPEKYIQKINEELGTSEKSDQHIGHKH